MRLPQNQFIQANQGTASMSMKEQYNAHKQLVEDFNYDSKLQETVMEEIRNAQQNPQSKTLALDQVLEAQNEIVKIEAMDKQQMGADLNESDDAYFGGQPQEHLL